jgi:hypothetical protein
LEKRTENLTGLATYTFGIREQGPGWTTLFRLVWKLGKNSGCGATIANAIDHQLSCWTAALFPGRVSDWVAQRNICSPK